MNADIKDFDMKALIELGKLKKYDPEAYKETLGALKDFIGILGDALIELQKKLEEGH